jgi:hypothetical protein
VKKKSLKEIWKNFEGTGKYKKSYFCPFREESKIIPNELVQELKSEFSSDFSKSTKIEKQLSYTH